MMDERVIGAITIALLLSIVWVIALIIIGNPIGAVAVAILSHGLMTANVGR
jgi:purine-cytosine permease-like protein